MGTANVFCTVEPKAGIYINTVTKKRTCREFGKFLASTERKYSEAEKITIVMDNLNIHRISSLEKMYGKEKRG